MASIGDPLHTVSRYEPQRDLTGHPDTKPTAFLPINQIIVTTSHMTMNSLGFITMRIAYLFGAIGSTLGQLREKPSHFCEDSSVQFQLERETRIELATLCLGSKCSTTELLPLKGKV